MHISREELETIKTDNATKRSEHGPVELILRERGLLLKGQDRLMGQET